MMANLIGSLLCSLMLVACSFGQAVQQKHDVQTNTLIALERMWNQAQLTRDVGAIRTLLSERFINTEWDGAVSGRDRFLADIRDPRFKPSIMSTEDMKVELYETTAVVTGRYHTKGTSQGKPYDHVGRFTDTWIFVSGSWQCVASHTSLVKQ
jgi:hypothetical protein